MIAFYFFPREGYVGFSPEDRSERVARRSPARRDTPNQLKISLQHTSTIYKFGPLQIDK